ncbi:YheC/YheD family protein [Falsibacillus pallidus]|uniref:YheC/D-like protein n=1 Tax=Falsibacillus pallidus TaxID=493781 RepID=A0A370GW40_9BACI|nr:YheC/YheD family protein [Falsibacillus pallidus]RDI47888.1 YheC/D-like protein [Falsibacillus pallidus]
MAALILFHINEKPVHVPSFPGIFLSPEDGDALGLKDGQQADVQIGNKKSAALIFLQNDLAEGMGKVDSALYNQLGIPHQIIRWNVRFHMKDGHIKLGPFLSILTEIRQNGNGQPHFGSIHCFAEELHAFTQKNGGYLSLMGLPSSVSSTGSPSSFYLDGDQWTRAVLPLPDVVYNRIHSRRTERSEVFKMVYSHLIDEGTVIFNPHFLSKWEVHQFLRNESHLLPYIPITDLYSRSVLAAYLDEFGAAFIKPIHGSQGRGIIEIKRKNDTYHISQTNYHQVKDHQFSELREAENLIAGWIGKRACIIQQSLQLISLDDKKIDFRLLVHPNRSKKWTVTSSVARLSAENQFVSNLAQGGTINKPLAVLREFFKPETAHYIYSLMKELAVESSKTLSESIEGVAGEFGLDIGVDQSGKTWIIEVNTKPSKQSEQIQSPFRPSTRAIWNFAEILWQERRLQDD